MSTTDTSKTKSARPGRTVDPDTLLKTLSEHSDAPAGRDAAETLVRLGDARAIEPLRRILGHKNAPARLYAARLLGEYRAVPAIPDLVRLITDTNRDVRAAVAFALGRIGTADSFAPLVEALGDSEVCVRAKAVEALGELGDTRAVSPLTDALDDDNAGVRAKARRALKALGQKANGEQEAGAKWERVEWSFSPEAEESPEGGPEPDTGPDEEKNTEALLRAVGEKGPGWLEAAGELADAGELRAIEPMLQGFAGCRQDHRKVLAGLLAGMGRIAHLALVQALEDPEPDVRAGAALALGMVGTDSAREALLRAAGDSDARVRASVTGALVEPLRDPDPEVRRRAAEVLEELDWKPGGTAGEASLLMALGRWEQAAALGAPAAATIAGGLCFDDDSSRREAARALVAIGAGAGEILLKELALGPEAARAQAAWALGELRLEGAEEKLVTALEDACPEVREAALVALLRLEARDRLDSIAARLTDEADFVRVTAVEVIGFLGNGRVADALIERLADQSPDVRRVAVETLAPLAEKKAVRALLRLLGDEDRGVRYAAEQAVAALNRD